jgi:hypothetical protein
MSRPQRSPIGPAVAETVELAYAKREANFTNLWRKNSFTAFDEIVYYRSGYSERCKNYNPIFDFIISSSADILLEIDPDPHSEPTRRPARPQRRKYAFYIKIIERALFNGTSVFFKRGRIWRHDTFEGRQHHQGPHCQLWKG